jgi:transposase-like protein
MVGSALRWQLKAAARRFIKRVLRSSPVPRKIVTDQLRSYPAAKAEIPELANGICCALHSIANTSRRDSLPGAKSPKSPKIRPTRSDGRFSCRFSASVSTS